MTGRITSKRIIKVEVSVCGMYLGEFVVDISGGQGVRIDVDLLVGKGYLSFSLLKHEEVGITSLIDVLGHNFICDAKLVSIPADNSSLYCLSSNSCRNSNH